MSKENLYRITIPKRGIKVIPPRETQEKMALAKQGIKVDPFSPEEKYRLRKIMDCKVLEGRYPAREDGLAFMQEVDLGWRNELLSKASGLAGTIVEEWNNISTNPIAVLLYGSVAKGLTKRPDHYDPSNIDLAVIGAIGSEERDALYDAIRPERLRIQSEILSNCPALDSPETNPGNAGVSIQDLNKLRSNYYYGVRMYIQAGALPLFDEYNVWAGIESEAIAFARSHKTSRGKSL